MTWTFDCLAAVGALLVVGGAGWALGVGGVLVAVGLVVVGIAVCGARWAALAGPSKGRARTGKGKRQGEGGKLSPHVRPMVTGKAELLPDDGDEEVA